MPEIGTIAANLRLGRPTATDAELTAAARASGADGFVAELPDGYQTVLGRDGGTLSVGRKQRLCPAGGLVRNAPVLILDEPTAALDPETERALMDGLASASRERIVFVIAHRLSTVARADRILVMEDGRIVESGTHNELLAKTRGTYRRFVEGAQG